MRHNHKGMTLIEVLIASTILFMVISAVTMIVRTNVLYQQRLEIQLDDSYSMDSVLDEINYYLEYTDQVTGTALIGRNSYEWSAEMLEKKPVVSSLDASVADENHDRGFLLIYQVSIRNLRKTFRPKYYTKLVWRQN
ncbi:PilW family protein [Paraglaciecola hydrolytica]|uniref:Prepilin-type N-terminal cleavage/methylation domain-containing protein n=1 Tax=Paraglaciecola hydrolytica TaxID=1799789 RepID=A0A135ZYU3_9ALTE|nr:prepilin-type N-terminal cleavage/methylation domain-containing protein [Paraglaciecola hydrolytica]KXI28151.1 hypothetical protein AX660_17350 [Paraglaciecola hydrolytica]